MEVKVVVEPGQNKKQRFQRQVSIQEDTVDSRDDDELLLTGIYGDRFSAKPSSSRPTHVRPHYQPHYQAHCQADYQHFHHRQQPHEPYKCSCLVKSNRVEVVELERANCSYRRPINELYAELDLPERDKSVNQTLAKAHHFRRTRKRQVNKPER